MWRWVNVFGLWCAFEFCTSITENKSISVSQIVTSDVFMICVPSWLLKQKEVVTFLFSNLLLTSSESEALYLNLPVGLDGTFLKSSYFSTDMQHVKPRRCRRDEIKDEERMKGRAGGRTTDNRNLAQLVWLGCRGGGVNKLLYGARTFSCTVLT